MVRMFLEELKSKYALGCVSSVSSLDSVNMASAKKKLDEYHLKVLRQLVTLPANKECFDCHQRGPTYVNVTIGSFVCTTCSGMLRGLTPPHRVKSISMATFTPDEIDFVKARGNDFCRRTWLGLIDSQPPTKDEQQIKDFMIAKYERKRYYIDQAVASTLNKTVNGNTPSPSKSASSVESLHTIPVLPSHTAVTTTTVHPHPTTLAFKPLASQSTTNNNAFTPEPFADFSKISIPPPSDPFNSSQSAAAPSQPSFANFDNNPVFNGSNSTGMPGVGETATVPGEDRYAALKDLDSLMKSQQQQQQQLTAETAPADWNAGTTNGMTNAWLTPSLFPATLNQTKDATTTSNPFKANGAWNNGNAMNVNPFRNNRPLSTEGIWSCGSNSQIPNGFTTSQSLNFGAQKVPWSSETVNNPFVLGTSPQSAGLHSSNPFL